MTKFTPKTNTEIHAMTEGGKLLHAIKLQLAKAAKPGVTGLDLEELAQRLIKQAGAQAAFARVPGYKWATCINVNDVVVHGIPDTTKLKTGDYVGIDVGLYYRGLYTDTSTTVLVGKQPDHFLSVGQQALQAAITKAVIGNTIWDLSQAMQTTVEAAGFACVTALTGHGIGRNLHEEPAIPCFTVGSRKHSPKIVANMTLAIEIMYNQGQSEVVYKNDDGWTIATADGKISGLFEDTIVVTSNGPVVLT